MNPLVVLLLALGGFLIMDSVCEKRIEQAVKQTKRVVKYVPMSLYDEQLGGRSMRDKYGDMFSSGGPWRFRDDHYGGAGPKEGPYPFDEERGDIASSPDSVAAERRRVEERLRKRFEKERPGMDASAEPFAPVVRDGAGLREARRLRQQRRSGARAGGATPP